MKLHRKAKSILVQWGSCFTPASPGMKIRIEKIEIKIEKVRNEVI